MRVGWALCALAGAASVFQQAAAWALRSSPSARKCLPHSPACDPVAFLRVAKYALNNLRTVQRSCEDCGGGMYEPLLEHVDEALRYVRLGGGLAVPHGILPEGQPMVGVMALSREGLDFDTPDERPVHCMVLLGTSPDERDRHLQVLAALARTVGTDRAFQDQLFDSKSPAHAYELLHGEESEDFNYFMEEALEG